MLYDLIQSQNVISFMLTPGSSYDAQSSWQFTSAFQPIQGPLTNVQFPEQSGGSAEFPPIEGGEFEVAPSEDQNGDEEKSEEQSSGQCNELGIINVSASGFESDPTDYHPPSDAIDGDSSTWWSNNGQDPWLEIDLGESHSICSVAIEWNKGDKREFSFEIEVSEDGNSYEKVFEGKNKGTLEEENYQFDDQTSGQHIKLTITDTSSKDGWTSIQEINALGQPNSQFLG
jgi:F5/8 type C domain